MHQLKVSQTGKILATFLNSIQEMPIFNGSGNLHSLYRQYIQWWCASHKSTPLSIKQFEMCVALQFFNVQHVEEASQ